MLRKRLVLSASLFGLIVAAGCSSTCPSDRPFLDRFRLNRNRECCPSGGDPIVSEGGPVISEGQGAAVLPPAQGAPTCPTPTTTTPPLAPAPRLVPTPTQQAQPQPFVPR
jgi:hypothetical protein